MSYFGPKVREMENELEQLRSQLGNLLAIIHRDGGHHQNTVGDVQAVKDAVELMHTRWVLNEHMTDINNVIAKLDAARAQVIELTAENERLKRVILDEIGEWRLNPEFNKRYCPICHYAEDVGHRSCPLSQPTPTGLGAPVLALARTAVATLDSVKSASQPLGWDTLFSAYGLGAIQDAAQPFIESPELRKMLGVE